MRTCLTWVFGAARAGGYSLAPSRMLAIGLQPDSKRVWLDVCGLSFTRVVAGAGGRLAWRRQRVTATWLARGRKSHPSRLHAEIARAQESMHLQRPALAGLFLRVGPGSEHLDQIRLLLRAPSADWEQSITAARSLVLHLSGPSTPSPQAKACHE